MDPRVPGFNVRPPEQERQFQTFMAFAPSVREWRNKYASKYGEQPRIEGGNYDYRAAFEADARPSMGPGDSVPHWPSVGKAADHPTMWKQQFMTQFGVDPDQVGQWTPEMQQFMSRQIGGGLF